jgi:hypothetical protein
MELRGKPTGQNPEYQPLKYRYSHLFYVLFNVYNDIVIPTIAGPLAGLYYFFIGFRPPGGGIAS